MGIRKLETNDRTTSASGAHVSHGYTTSLRRSVAFLRQLCLRIRVEVLDAAHQGYVFPWGPWEPGDRRMRPMGTRRTRYSPRLTPYINLPHPVNYRPLAVVAVFIAVECSSSGFQGLHLAGQERFGIAGSGYGFL